MGRRYRRMIEIGDAAMAEIDEMLEGTAGAAGVVGDDLQAAFAGYAVESDIGNIAFFEMADVGDAAGADGDDAIDAQRRQLVGAVAETYELDADVVAGGVEGLGHGADGFFDGADLIGPEPADAEDGDEI